MNDSTDSINKDNNENGNGENKAPNILNHPPPPLINDITEDIRDEKDTTYNHNNVPENKGINDIPPKWEKKHSAVNIIIQGSLALLTIATLIVFIISMYQQGRSTKNALARADTANYNAKKSLDISTLAFKMARISDSTDSIMTIKDTLARDRNTRMELRAYFVAKKFDHIKIEKNILQKFSIIMINTGKTPAYKISCWNGIKIEQGVTQNDFDLLTQNDPKIETGCIGSGQDLAAEIKLFYNPANKDTINKISIGIFKVNYFGIFTYYDIFGEKHFTKYNVQFIPRDTTFYINKNHNNAN